MGEPVLWQRRPPREFLTLYGDDVLPALRGQAAGGRASTRRAIERARALWQRETLLPLGPGVPRGLCGSPGAADWAENPGFRCGDWQSAVARCKNRSDWIRQCFSG